MKNRAPHRKGNDIRIVGGDWRSRRIRFAPTPGLRPTPDRVRETLFNWLGQDLTGLTCLDLFAGSGALGFEAASRGAKRVVMVERERVAYAALVANREALDARRVELVQRDAIEFLETDKGEYDVIFVDPPFAESYWPRLVSLLPARMAVGSLVYCESPRAASWSEPWQVVKQRRAGQVVYQLVKRVPA